MAENSKISREMKTFLFYPLRIRTTMLLGEASAPYLWCINREIWGIRPFFPLSSVLHTPTRTLLLPRGAPTDWRLFCLYHCLSFLSSPLIHNSSFFKIFILIRLPPFVEIVRSAECGGFNDRGRSDRVSAGTWKDVTNSTCLRSHFRIDLFRDV